jgi:phosphoglycerol transferase MdoB-like AlkP superfamily enzyme
VFLLVLIALALGKAVLARGLALSWSVALAGVWFEAAIVVVLIGAAAVAFKHRSHPLMLAIYTVYCILIFADALYSGFFQQMLDPQMFQLAGQATEITDIIASLLSPVYLWFFIDIPLLIVWAVMLRRRHAVYQRRGVAIATGVALGVLALQLVLVTSIPAGTDSATVATKWGITPMQLASLGNMMLPKHTNAFAGVAAASRDSANGATSATDTAAVANAVSAFNSRLGEYGPGGGQRIASFPVGALKGKSVIIVQFESLEGMFVDGKVQGQAVTPNVNRFVHDSWYFPNTYSQTGIGNTADAEFTLATSMLPPLPQNATTAYADRQLPALPRLLDAAGYETITLHTNDANFWFRTDLYKAVGYQKWYDKSYFKDRDQMWRGSSDEVFFQDGLVALKKHLATGKPTLATFVTMTSHMGYNFPVGQARRPLKLSPQLASSYAGKYAGSISYADKAFGEFIAGLKAAGIYDDAIIVLIGDHMGYKTKNPTAQDNEIINELLGREYSYVDHQRVAFAIHVPGKKPKVVTSMRASQDIMPSVADLLGVDLSTTPHFGRSAFVEGPRLVPMRAYFPGGSYVDNNIVFVTGPTEGEDQAFDIATSKEVTAPSRNDSKVATVRQFNTLSDEWLMSQPVRAGGINRRQSGAGTTQQE